MSETPKHPRQRRVPRGCHLAEPGTLAEPVEAQAEELSTESLRIASQLAEGYRVSPLDMVPNPSPLLVESTEEVAVPTRRACSVCAPGDLRTAPSTSAPGRPRS